MLITPSNQWQRTVLHLALQSGLRNFCAHHHCQTLCDEWLRGNNRAPGSGKIAVLRSRKAPDLLGTLKLIGFAALPLRHVWGAQLQWSLPVGATPEEVEEAENSLPPVIKYYRIPQVKGVVRLAIHIMYTLFISYLAMETNGNEHSPLLGHATMEFHSGGGLERTWLDVCGIVWTISLIMDEWYKYIQQPTTFSPGFWNQFDYMQLTLTMVAMLMRFFDITAAVEILAFALLFIWCRIFKYLTSNQSIGLLVIMIMNMFKDIVLWGLVSAIFVIAYTCAFVTLANPDTVEHPSRATTRSASRSGDARRL